MTGVGASAVRFLRDPAPLVTFKTRRCAGVVVDLKSWGGKTGVLPLSFLPEGPGLVPAPSEDSSEILRERPF